MLMMPGVNGSVSASSGPPSDFEWDALAPIVLAGSQTWRDTPFDNLMSRPLLPVAQLPLIGYALRWLRAAGAPRATVCANGASAEIARHLRPYRRAFPALAFHDDRAPRGAAGSARDAALGTDAAFFVVVDATTVPDVDLARVATEHRATGAALTIVVQPAGRDSAQTGLVPTGIYLFSRRALEAVPPTGYQDIKESLIPRLYAQGELVTTTEAEGVCPRVLEAQTYLSVSQRLIAETTGGRRGFGMDGAGMAEATLHPRARVSPSALLIGPVIVEENAEIRDGATIVGPASIGAGSVVECGALISRSVLWANCVVGEGAVVDRCVLAEGVRVAGDSQLVGAVRSGERKRGDQPAVTPPMPELEPAVSVGRLAYR